MSDYVQYWTNLGLSRGTARRLTSLGFQSIDELKGKSSTELLKLKGFGAVTLYDVRKLLRREQAGEQLRLFSTNDYRLLGSGPKGSLL